MPQPPRAGYSSVADATRLVNQFATETQTHQSDHRSSRVVAATGVWPGVSKADLAAGIRARIADPNAIDQRRSPLCGPSALFRCLAWDDPVAYAQAAIDLYYRGAADVYGLTIRPGERMRKAAPGMGLQAADWVTLAGLRDSENALLSPADADWFGHDAHGITLPGALEGWLRAAGYNKTASETYLCEPQKRTMALRTTAVKAAKLFDQGYWVALFINIQLLYASVQDDFSLVPNHWVVLTDRLTVDVIGRTPVTAKVYTWGGERTVPEVPSDPISERGFNNNFYGYVAAKWEPSA